MTEQKQKTVSTMTDANHLSNIAAAVYQTIFARRDMRHFKKDSDRLPNEQLMRFFNAAHAGPSVGYMQPWRFIHITDSAIRGELKSLVEKERQKTATALNEREAEFLDLKIDGMDHCSDIVVVCLSNNREPYILGRRTMPQMDLASASCAIQNMWLAARAENIGMGWVSIFEPQDLSELLKLPIGADPIAILCLGEVDAFYDKPMLEQQGWDERKSLDCIVMQNQWRD